MGRELKRVPMDFDWPLGEIWHGYLNPHYRECPHCDNGYTTGGRYLNQIVNLLLLAGSDAATNHHHPYFDRMPVPFPQESPSSDIAELTKGLAGRACDGLFGHDAIDRFSAGKKIIAAAGLDPETWGICPHCNGEDIDPEVKEAYEAWQRFDPPTGDGYQLWGTTSEGEPRSPVFATLDELCAWCEVNDTTFGRNKATAEQWKAMLTDGLVYHREGNNVFI